MNSIENTKLGTSELNLWLFRIHLTWECPCGKKKCTAFQTNHSPQWPL